MELESVGSGNSLVPDATGRQSQPVRAQPVRGGGDGSGDGRAAEGAKKAVPDKLVELLMGHGGETDEFDPEDRAADPANLAQVDHERWRVVRHEDVQPDIAAGEHRSIAGDGAAGCRQVRQRAFAHAWGAAENDRVGDGKAIGGPCLMPVSHAVPWVDGARVAGLGLVRLFLGGGAVAKAFWSQDRKAAARVFRDVR